jgi:hypothetical protein
VKVIPEDQHKAVAALERPVKKGAKRRSKAAASRQQPAAGSVHSPSATDFKMAGNVPDFSADKTLASGLRDRGFCHPTPPPKGRTGAAHH